MAEDDDIDSGYIIKATLFLLTLAAVAAFLLIAFNPA
jgi:hypothetical protein